MSHAAEVEKITEDFHEKIFKPEASAPLKTLDLPLGGSVSPVDALSLLIDFLAIAGSRVKGGKTIEMYQDDASGAETVKCLKDALQVLNRITGSTPASLGLHPAVYFYNERGKYSKFLFLGMVLLIQEALVNNDKQFFVRFTESRAYIEQFLIDHKSLLGIVLQNLGKQQRVPKMRDLFSFLVGTGKAGVNPSVEDAISHLGLRGRIVDVNAKTTTTSISDDTKSMVYVRQAIKAALVCPICKGLLDPSKSVHFDHKIAVRDGGTGDQENAQMVHPYCNTGYKEGVLVPEAANKGTRQTEVPI